jgi:RND superfamily putative drug exporter
LGALVALTDWCLRHRVIVLAAWLAAVGAGVAGALGLSPLLSSGFSLPGTDSARVSAVLARDFPSDPDADFVLIVKGSRPLANARRAGAEAARALPGGRVSSTELLPSGRAAAFVGTSLSSGAAQNATGALRARLGPGVLVTGDPAVQYDIGPALARALEQGELYLAVPVALVILMLVFGTGSALLPFVFATFTITPALGIAWGVAHVLELSNYLLNMVMMIGLGIAIDYSLLVVNRYRDERRQGRGHEDAVRETMLHAGRTILFSGLVVSLGLALMLLLPVPFLRGFGVGGLLVPVLSIACALSLLPVMLLTLGERLEAIHLLPQRVAERRHALEYRLWASHTSWVMRRAKLIAPLVAAGLVLTATPLIGVHVGPSSTRSLPQGLASVRGLVELQAAGGSYSSDPTTIIVERHGTGASLLGTTAAVARFDRLLHADPEVASVSSARRASSGSDLRIEVVSRPDPASPQAQSFAERLRSVLIPAAHFPGSAVVLAGGGAAYAADFVSRTLGAFPWLILGVLAVTYLVLVRAFRSLLLPLKAILLNLLTVSAASGLMIALFQWGWGSWAGLLRVNQIEGWIPVFMFTLLFGLSMDYEVFLVTRMREVWDATRSNQRAVVGGVANTGRIVTAAGLIMAATFSGLMVGSIPTMQQLGFGLAVAILIDITLVRGLLLPSTMALAGRWNWYLPRWAERALVIRS